MKQALYLWTLVAAATTGVVAKMHKSNVKVENVESRFMIHIPHKLFKAEGYHHQESQFGSPHYGGAIVQQIVYVETTLCSPRDEGPYKDHHKDHHHTTVTLDQQYAHPRDYDGPFILMVDVGGGCSMAVKVRNAQDLGAAAVLLAGDRCVCSDEQCLSNSDNPTTSSCYDEEPLMASMDISIPSFVLSHSDADLIKQELMFGSSRYVQAEMSWSMPHASRELVDYELWMNPASDAEAPFLRDFMVLASVMESFTRFRPKTFILDGEATGCRKAGSDCGKMDCTNHGRYCANKYMFYSQMIYGRDIVRENLRRICIWNLYGHDGTAEFSFAWWHYVIYFAQHCLLSDNLRFTDPQCIQEAYNNARIIKEDVDACMEHSGGLDEDRTNALLETQLVAKNDRYIVSMPSIIVNDALVPGSFSAGNVFFALCAGFSEDAKPEVCVECTNCYDPTQCFWRHHSNWQKTDYYNGVKFDKNRDMPNGGCFQAQLPLSVSSTSTSTTSSSSNLISTKFFGFSIFFIAIIFLGLATLQHRRQKVEMQHQVRSIVGSYMPLHCEEDF